jgi:hypothetical protein
MVNARIGMVNTEMGDGERASLPGGRGGRLSGATLDGPARPPPPRRGAMAAERLSMRQIREVLRQKSGAWGSATRPPPAASASGWARSPAWLARARVIGLDWPQVQALTDGVLEPRL